MPERILVLEDELSIQSVLCELLTDAGYEVRAADNGIDGLAEYRRGHFDLILLDIMMPRLDGYGVCRAVREHAPTPIIMLTALDDEEAQVKAFELQADDYITKPFSLKLVLLRVEAVLRRSRQPDPQSRDIFLYGELRLEAETMRGNDRGPKWAGENIDLWASVEPGGIQIAGVMPEDIWKTWYHKLKTDLSSALGYEIGELEDGYDFKYWG